MNLLRSLSLLVFCLVCSCAKYPPQKRFAPKDTSFTLTVDYEGDVRNFGRDVENPYILLREDLTLIEKKLLEDSSYTRIAIIVHGGLVSPQAAAEASQSIAKEIDRENKRRKKEKIFPIFINWDTDLFNSYWRHLVSDEAGITANNSFIGPFSPEDGYMIPLKLVGDVGAGISKAPAHLVRSVIRFGGRNPGIGKSLPELYPAQSQVYEAIEENFPGYDIGRHQHKAIYAPFSQSRQDFHFNFQLGESLVPAVSEKMITAVPWTPFKIASSPLADSIGTPSWDNMKRRASLLAFRPQHHRPDYLPGDRTRGAGNLLLTRLACLCHKNKRLKLELYGHSMGAIVINQLINSIQVEGFKAPAAISKIVYMAAACRISDFTETTGRFVQEHSIPFSNLMLHPTQEVRETLINDYGSPIVAGSLLTWIDEMFERPPSFQDRTLGSFINTVIARDILPKGSHVHMKAFPADFQKGRLFRRDRNSKLGPQTHGEFNNYPFWRPSFHNVSAGLQEHGSF